MLFYTMARGDDHSTPWLIRTGLCAIILLSSSDRVKFTRQFRYIDVSLRHAECVNQMGSLIAGVLTA